MEETQTKFDWKQLAIVVVAMLATAGVVGGGMYVVNGSCKKDLETTKNTLNQAVDSLRSTSKTTTSTTAVTAAVSGIYTNENGKFSVSLPSDYVVSEGFYGCEGLCGQQIGIVKKQTSLRYKDIFVSVNYYIHPEGTTLTEALKETDTYKGATTTKDVKVAGVNAKYYVVPGMFGDSKHYYFVNKGIVYHIEMSSMSQGEDAFFDQFVKSFKLN